ncbi:MAG TPA: CBS domain-containing protein [Longimicrobium sp.]|nr:CBS domain-containing protein [Longimicrobium sp.]
MKARDLMTPRPHVVLSDEPLLKAAEIMRDHDVGAVPVVDGRESMRLVGVITDRDLAVRHVAAAHHRDCAVRQHMTYDSLVTVRPNADADDVMKKMRRCKVRRVMVTDEDGVLRGIIAQADVVRLEGGDHPRRVEKVLEEISEPVGLPR